jgi:hypothetical protein
VKAWLARPEAALFALVLGAYAYFYQAGGWNQNSRFDLVRAIVEDGSIRIDKYRRNTGDLSKREGHYYCDKAPGVSFLAVPGYALTRGLGATLATSAWFAAVVAVGVPSAIAAVMLALLLAAMGVRAGPACAAAAAWSLATLAWPYGTLLYGHQTLAALLIIGFALLAIPRVRKETPPPLRLVLAGAVLGYAVVVEYPAALACVVIGVYTLVVFGPRAAGLLALGAVPPAIALAAYHTAGFGGPLTLPYEFSTQPHRSMGFFMGIGVPKPEALWHILLSDYRGLFFTAPWLLLAIPGGVQLVRAGRRAEAAVCAAIFVLFVWLNASLVDWQGGWAMGARYLVPCLPFVVLAAAGLLVAPPASRALRRGLLAVAVAGVAWAGAHMLIGTAVKPEVPVHIKKPFAAYLYPRFFDGKLSVSTQSIDAAGHPAKGPRAAWNLGQRAGLDGAASLLPLIVWMLALGAAGARAARTARG